MIVILAIAAAYQLFAIVACLFRKTRPRPADPAKAVSILKPVDGIDAGFRQAIASHLNLRGNFELLCGVRSLDDPAVTLLRREFPTVRIVECRTKTPNGKAGVLIDLAAAARYPVLVVNDADIRVEPTIWRASPRRWPIQPSGW